MLASVALVSLLFCSSSLAAPATVAKTVKFPFAQMVAFGDNLSDNGNGSYAHCIASIGHCSNSIYGYRTWTNGPVAVSYLADMLNVPLTQDFAMGHAQGGSKFGATIDNNYTKSTANVSSAVQQIASYTGSIGYNRNLTNNTLHFLWIGANDMNLLHMSTNSPNNTAFATQFSTRLAAAVQSLLSAGAGYVFVPNLYPKHISPSSEFYCNSATQVANFGSSIQQANTAIAAALKPLGKQVIYYDVFSFMVNLWNNHSKYGITHVGGEFCDGYSQKDWDLCVTDHQGDTFFWMQYLDMTTHVHNLVAQDMYKKLKSHFASST